MSGKCLSKCSRYSPLSTAKTVYPASSKSNCTASRMSLLSSTSNILICFFICICCEGKRKRKKRPLILCAFYPYIAVVPFYYFTRNKKSHAKPRICLGGGI